MLSAWFVFLVALAYLCLLFGIAYLGDKRAGGGRSLVNNPYIYTLSIAVYCTSWTFYGSVGRSASKGLDFLPIYLGPTLVFLLWPVLLGKIIRISKVNRITSIADFIASRYGKSPMLGGLVTVIAVVGIMPYIALQLKAVASTLEVLVQASFDPMIDGSALGTWAPDTALVVAMVLSIFTILFGTRHIDASEHHEGMVTAIAFESVVKLIAFICVGVFVVYVVHDGFRDLFAKASEVPRLSSLMSIGEASGYGGWVALTLLSMVAMICLPRQFQVTMIENVDERHLRKAAWLFPLYLLLINIFVLPIALSGLLLFPDGSVDADTFVLTIPLHHQRTGLALLAFIGGLSAATGMVIVATIALSTMICNDLVMPVLLRVRPLGLSARADVGGLLVVIRRIAIILILLLSYFYYFGIGESYALVTIGLVSFMAAAQFAPSIIGGIFWKGATRHGATIGLVLGFVVWIYTLLLPSLALSGWLPIGFVGQGPAGIAWLRPYQLFWLEGLDHISHALFWSMLLNIGGYVGVSLFTRQSDVERVQAALFVDVFRLTDAQYLSISWGGSASVAELRDLAARFLGEKRAENAFNLYMRGRGLDPDTQQVADADLIAYTERLLTGIVGSSSARVVVASVAKGEFVGIDQVMEILDEASQVIRYSQEMEQKSRELERATSDLRAANARLRELDRMKDDFLSTISHELRTPLTSIRSFAEILADNRDLTSGQRTEFSGVIIRESERLTRLIDQILELSRLEAGRMEWRMDSVDLTAAVEQVVSATQSLFADGQAALRVKLPNCLPLVYADHDRLIQVLVNLLSNAAKFCRRPGGVVALHVEIQPDRLLLHVDDNGPGVSPNQHEAIFYRFHQAGETLTQKPAGTGLGLAICREIVNHFGGHIWVAAEFTEGARFSFTLPVAQPESLPVASG